MWTLRAPGGRRAVFCGDDPDLARVMAAELFGSLEGVVMEERREPAR